MNIPIYIGIPAIVIAGICLVITLTFCWRMHRQRKQILADIRSRGRSIQVKKLEEDAAQEVLDGEAPAVMPMWPPGMEQEFIRLMEYLIARKLMPENPWRDEPEASAKLKDFFYHHMDLSHHYCARCEQPLSEHCNKEYCLKCQMEKGPSVILE